MSPFSSHRLTRINIPLVLLWLASAVSAALGYILMSSSNSEQAKLYSAESADYEKLLSAQSGSTLGGTLIAVGVLGLLLALTAHTITRSRSAEPGAAALGATEVDDENDDEPAESPGPDADTADAATTDQVSANAADAEPAAAR